MEAKRRKERDKNKRDGMDAFAYLNQFCQFQFQFTFKLLAGLPAWIKVESAQCLHRKNMAMISSRTRWQSREAEFAFILVLLLLLRE